MNSLAATLPDTVALFVTVRFAGALALPTVVLPAAGSGVTTIGEDALTNGTMLDLRQALAGTDWNGSAATLSSYLGVMSSPGTSY